MWYVYLLRCSDGSLYAGSTTDVERRLREHAAGRGGAYTRSRRPVRLVYREPQPDRARAQHREWVLKQWSHAQKLALVGSRNCLVPLVPVRSRRALRRVRRH